MKAIVKKYLDLVQRYSTGDPDCEEYKDENWDLMCHKFQELITFKKKLLESREQIFKIINHS